MKYRKRPVIVDAVLWDTINEKPDWFHNAMKDGTVTVVKDHVYIKTLEGILCADSTDWLIRGIAGEIYPCKHDIFELTYEKI